MGRSTEITRDELKFTKFVQRLRKKFTVLFHDLLRTQLILTGVIAEEEWDSMKEHITYDFLQDGHFAELKEAEILRERLDMLGNIDSYIGTFFSKKWVQRNVLNMTDYEIDDMQREINKEAGDDVEDGGVDLPQDTDGVTRYPSQGGNIIAPDAVDKYDNNEPPQQGGNDNE